MKGLRITRIESEGLRLNFSRFQLWEHELIYVQATRPLMWQAPGKIIHHLQDKHEVTEYVHALARQYDDVIFDYQGEL